jgi:hypothetical protein
VASGDQKKQLVQIWITTSNGEVLIKDFSQNQNTIALNMVAIESRDINSAIKEVEKSTNILCSKDNLSEAYCLEENSEHSGVEGFVLSINLNDEHKSLVEEKFKGKFIDYKELTALLMNYKLDINFKEAFYSLIFLLEQRSSFHPSI